jgi:hypothetical protein
MQSRDQWSRCTKNAKPRPLVAVYDLPRTILHIDPNDEHRDQWSRLSIRAEFTPKAEVDGISYDSGQKGLGRLN